MKKKIIITSIISAVALFITLGAVLIHNYKFNQKTSMQESTMIDDDTFGDLTWFGSDNEYRLLASAKYPDFPFAPKVGYQKSDVVDDKISIRFIAAIVIDDSQNNGLDDIDATWTRQLLQNNGDAYSGDLGVTAQKDCTYAYSSLKEGEGTRNASDISTGDVSVGNYTHFVVYTLKNIPVNANPYILEASITLSKHNNATKYVSSSPIRSYATDAAYDYTVTLKNYDGSSEDDTFYVNANGSYEDAACTTPFSVAETSMTNYTFKGYFTDKAGNGDMAINADRELVFDHDDFYNNTTLYSSFETTVYFSKPHDWQAYTAAYAYYSENDGYKNASFPGVEMTAVSGSTFEYSIPVNALYDKIEFNDGDIGDNHHKTAVDVDVTSYNAYYCGGARYNLDTNITLNLETSSDWNKDNARFAVWIIIDGVNDYWKSFTGSGSNWSVTFPKANVTKVIFCRMAPNTENDWNNKWTQTPDLWLGDRTSDTYHFDGWDGSWKSI